MNIWPACPTSCSSWTNRTATAPSAGVRAINELKPVLGLELTATPFVETSKGAGAVQERHPRLSARQGDGGWLREGAGGRHAQEFQSRRHVGRRQIEQMKLEDGIRLHESVKVELETYARETGNVIVKPFVLVIARDTTHASQLMDLIQSDGFFEGRYKTKVIQVDSSKTGAEEDEMIERLLKVEHTDEPTEIVIHVNMLKEGWDVTNLYTIVPLRAANARILIEQSIGRGLRLPYGKRTGVNAVDRLNIIAHDKFQEIVDEANKPDSAIRLQQVIMSGAAWRKDGDGGFAVATGQPSWVCSLRRPPPARWSPSGGCGSRVHHAGRPEGRADRLSGDSQSLENQPQNVPERCRTCQDPEVQAEVVQGSSAAQFRPTQLELEGVTRATGLCRDCCQDVGAGIQQTIDIPRILVVPTGKVQSGFQPVHARSGHAELPGPSEELWTQHLRTDQRDSDCNGQGRH